MYLELACLVAIIAGIVIAITELTKMTGLGLIAGVLLLFLAYWIYGSGLQMITGTTTTTCESVQMCSDATATNVYSPIPATPFIDMTNILAFCSMLAGLYVIVHYAMDWVNPDGS